MMLAAQFTSDSPCPLPLNVSATTTPPVVSAVRSELDCERLDLHADMADLDFEYEGVEYSAKKVHYEPFVQFQGRHSWTGAIVEPTTVGSVTVTWNDDCDAAVFALQVRVVLLCSTTCRQAMPCYRLCIAACSLGTYAQLTHSATDCTTLLHTQVTLADSENGTRHMIRSVPCDDFSEIPNCTWLALLELQPRDEFEAGHVHRRAIEDGVALAHAEDSELQELDDDIELLRYRHSH
jgi:hypothetical protein